MPPIYEVMCTKCEWQGEKLCKYEELPEQTCEVCDSGVEKLLSSPAGVKVGGVGAYNPAYHGRTK